MSDTPFRIEHDSMGQVAVPATALYGAQTQRAVDNFSISGQQMPRSFLRALGLIKAACASTHQTLGLLDDARAAAIVAAALEVAEGQHDAHFPVDIFQTGSGTSSNMNANEVIAHLASSHLSEQHAVHPNDHVNLGQSSNDVIPTAIQVAAVCACHDTLLPALEHLQQTLVARIALFGQIVKTGRTHLMDAMPLTLAQEWGAWLAQLDSAKARLRDSLPRVASLPLGGSAIGTGINAHVELGPRAAAWLSRQCAVNFQSADNLFAGIAAKDECVELSGQLNTLACTLMKIGNDLRWMNSGPLAGLAEIELPALQPGSSIMPGKVNPVIAEALCMVCAQVMGNHLAVTIGGQSGNFQLNVMLPLIARNLLESIHLLSGAMRALADRCVAGIKVNGERLQAALALNPILVTALNPVIGYERGAAIAKQAYQQQRPVLEVAVEQTGLPHAELAALLDPATLTTGGIRGGGGANKRG
jgi:fumarate hydratase class II